MCFKKGVTKFNVNLGGDHGTDWNYLGCFEDKGKRQYENNFGKLSPDECFKKVTEEGFRYAAFYNEGVCTGGKTFPERKKLADDDCTKPCKLGTN